MVWSERLHSASCVVGVCTRPRVCAEAHLAEVDNGLVDAQAQGQNGDAQAQLLICAVTLPRPHRLQLHLCAHIVRIGVAVPLSRPGACHA